MFSTKDILLYEAGGGGDISVQNGDIALAEILYQQAYLCLFGGNVAASTRGDELPTEIRQDWWGNNLLFANNKAAQFNSATERALRTNALNSTGRVNIQRAVEKDLQYFKGQADVAVTVAITGVDKLRIGIRLTQPTNQQGTSLQLLWDNGRMELITERVI
jgi:hypothetical protein